ncbi:MAG: hypothetical protein R2710_13610 [Acidimicrobiales bacterium]
MPEFGDEFLITGPATGGQRIDELAGDRNESVGRLAPQDCAAGVLEPVDRQRSRQHVLDGSCIGTGDP